MKIEELHQKINSGAVTVEDFNLFIENLPKGADERRMRTSQRLPKKSHSKQSPAKTAAHIARRGTINDPTKTHRGRKAVAKQGNRNKRNSDEFRNDELQNTEDLNEAVEPDMDRLVAKMERNFADLADALSEDKVLRHTRMSVAPALKALGSSIVALRKIVSRQQRYV